MAERHSELQRGAPVALDGAVGAVAEQHAHRLRAVALDGHVQRRRAGGRAKVDIGESGDEDADALGAVGPAGSVQRRVAQARAQVDRRPPADE